MKPSNNIFKNLYQNFKGLETVYKILIAFLVLFFAAFLCNKNLNPTNNNNSRTVGEVKNVDTLSSFQKGIKYYKENEFDLSMQWFQQVSNADSNFKTAQEYVKELSSKIQLRKNQEEKERKDADRLAKLKEQKREQMIKKYEKICKSGLYQFEIEQRLGNDDFYQLSSDFEKAPDGSTGVKQVFIKRFDEGFTIYVSLQNAYSLGKYYYKVWSE